jgi:hypothetical protein
MLPLGLDATSGPLRAGPCDRRAGSVFFAIPVSNSAEMSPEDLLRAVKAHSGTFLCERIHEPAITREFAFEHVVTGPDTMDDLPAVGRLAEAYASFGSIAFYHHEGSGDAARYLAPPSAWPALADELADWLDMIDDEDLAAMLPQGLDGCVVIGETPGSGNYILVPTLGPKAGQVIEFDHDGCEFNAVANDLFEYVIGMLTPDGSRLADFASHMRFIEGTPDEQWWIRECRDNAGRFVTTAS